MYEERRYREWVSSEGLKPSCAACRESDLFILAPIDVSEGAHELLLEARTDLEGYIQRDGRFQTTLVPHEPLAQSPLIVRRMAAATAKFGVGPMAAVAGAIAEYVGEGLMEESPEIVIENGGDIYARSERPLTVTLFAGGHSPFSGKVRFRVHPGGRPIGIATSSATVGPSLSFGRADAVSVIADSAVEADAAATAFGNEVKSADDVRRVIKMAQGYDGVRGLVVAIGDRLGIWGDVEIL